MRIALVAAGALAAALVVPTAASAHVHAARASAWTVPTPRAGDLTVEQLTLTSAAKPRVTVTGGTVYGSTVRRDAHHWTLRVVSLRRSQDKAVPARVTVPAGVGVTVDWTLRNVLHRATFLDLQGGEPDQACAAFGGGFRHLAGRHMDLPPRTVGADACLLAAHSTGDLHGWTRTTGVSIPRGIQQPWWPVATGAGVTASRTGWVRTGTRVSFTTGPRFTGWTGACSGTGTCVLSVRASVTVGATFAPAPASPQPSAAPSPSPPATFTRTGATLTEFRIVLSHPTLAAGPVQVVASDLGEDDHQLAVRDSSGTVLGETSTLHPQDEQSLALTLAPGTYTVFCPIADHEAMGMVTTLTVR